MIAVVGSDMESNRVIARLLADKKGCLICDLYRLPTLSRYVSILSSVLPRAILPVSVFVGNALILPEIEELIARGWHVVFVENAKDESHSHRFRELYDSLDGANNKQLKFYQMSKLPVVTEKEGEQKMAEDIESALMAQMSEMGFEFDDNGVPHMKEATEDVPKEEKKDEHEPSKKEEPAEPKEPEKEVSSEPTPEPEPEKEPATEAVPEPEPVHDTEPTTEPVEAMNEWKEANPEPVPTEPVEESVSVSPKIVFKIQDGKAVLMVPSFYPISKKNIDGDEYHVVTCKLDSMLSLISSSIGEETPLKTSVRAVKTRVSKPTSKPKTEKVKSEKHKTHRTHVDIDLPNSIEELVALKNQLTKEMAEARANGDMDKDAELRKKRRVVRKAINTFGV